MTATDVIHNIRTWFIKPVHLAPLGNFRVLFGILMSVSLVRFWANGWIYEMYILPKHFFPYLGFEWIHPLPGNGMYWVFGFMLAATICIALGLFYRLSSTTFFLLFTYVELIDKTNYLNHYYFISLVAFLMCLLPAARYMSLDNWRLNRREQSHAPRYTIWIIKAQLSIVYFMAGVAKINYDWLVQAQPLKLWLPSKVHLPVIGPLLTKSWVAYVFSWFGCAYDLFIPFILAIKRYVYLAFAAVVAFHMLTWILFPIGMFPFIMICATTIFFPEKLHRKVSLAIKRVVRNVAPRSNLPVPNSAIAQPKPWLYTTFAIFVFCQCILPFRYVMYPDNLFWTEEGYRFSWRVMLMEKAGAAFFYAHLPNGKKVAIDNSQFLTPNQEKMMATQPDMLLQYGRIIAAHFEQHGYPDVKVTSDVFVTLNGKRSQRFIDSEANLASLPYNLKHRDWVLPYTP